MQDVRGDVRAGKERHMTDDMRFSANREWFWRNQQTEDEK